MEKQRENIENDPSRFSLTGMRLGIRNVFSSLLGKKEPPPMKPSTKPRAKMMTTFQTLSDDESSPMRFVHSIEKKRGSEVVSMTHYVNANVRITFNGNEADERKQVQMTLAFPKETGIPEQQCYLPMAIRGDKFRENGEGCVFEDTVESFADTLPFGDDSKQELDLYLNGKDTSHTSKADLRLTFKSFLAQGKRVMTYTTVGEMAIPVKLQPNGSIELRKDMLEFFRVNGLQEPNVNA